MNFRMYWLLLSVLIVAIAAQADQQYVFTEDEETLSKCIKNFLENSSDPYYRNLKTLKDIADLAAKRFHGKSKDLFAFDWATNSFYYNLQDDHSHLFTNHNAYKPLRNDMKNALIKCVEQEVSLTPVFQHEPVEIGALLDYVLVVWPRSLYDMFRTKKARNLLRRYAEDALLRLARALIAVNDHGYFRRLLRHYWIVRASYYFDGRDAQIPYPRHRYSLRHPNPHTYDDFNALLPRSNRRLSDRNPWVPEQDYLRIMDIHTPDRPGRDENDVFSIYERNGGMTSVEYYIETQIDQFYRIIFYYMELQIRGLSNDEDDDYMGQLPRNVMPEQRILRTDFAYRNYLLGLRRRLEQSQTHLGPNLLGARVMEEDLVTLYSTQIQQQSVAESNTTSSPLKRKVSVDEEKEKNICKQPKPSCSGEGQQQQTTVSYDEGQNSNAIRPFPEEESSIFLSTLGLTMTEF